MANNQVPMLVELYKNNNTSSRTYGKYYGRCQSKPTLSLKGFAKHMTSHNLGIDYADLVHLLQKMVGCIKELACQGVPIKLDGLGTFYPGIVSKGADSVPAYSVDQHIEAVKLGFTPEYAGEDKLNGPALKAACSFQITDFVEVKKVAPDPEQPTKLTTIHTRYPVATWEINNPSTQGS